MCNLGNCVGIENVNTNLRRTFLSIFAIYGAFILVFTGIFYMLGFQNLITTGTFIVDTLTGVFSRLRKAFNNT